MRDVERNGVGAMEKEEGKKKGQNEEKTGDDIVA